MPAILFADFRVLALYVERGRLADGQEILELGCGWGSFSLYLAERFPSARITAVSNSSMQRCFIEKEARLRLLENLRVMSGMKNENGCSTSLPTVSPAE